MRCSYCNENEAAEIYKRIKNGVETEEHYCLNCYSRLFLTAETEDGDRTACPYCGMTLAEFRAGTLVGCASCYATMYAGIFPALVRMQGEYAHVGKTPPLLAEDEEVLEKNQYASRLEREAYRNAAIKQARFERQCEEMEILSEYLRSQKDYEGADGYEAKLSQMRSKSEVEEEFVWRTRRNLSKRP